MLSAFFVDNFVLSKFMGICPFLGVSNKLSSSLGMGAAVIFVMVCATAVTYPVYHGILEPNGLEYFAESARLLRGFNLDDLLAVIITAELAHAMAQLHLGAAGALHDARRGQLPMSAATRIPSCLGDFSLGSGHCYTSSLFST